MYAHRRGWCVELELVADEELGIGVASGFGDDEDWASERDGGRAV